MIDELKGKTLHGAEILDVSYGRAEVPEEIQEMVRKFWHKPNPSTGLWYRCIAKVKDKSYLADLRWTPDAGTECMIFRCDKDGNVLESGRSYYSRRGIPLSLRILIKCIDDFAKGEQDGQG